MDGALYAAWAPRLRRFCARWLGSRHDAEEVVQDVFTKLVQHGSRYELEHSPEVLLFRLVRNRCIDFQRRRRPQGLEGHEPAAREADRDLAEAIAQLPAEQREVLLLTTEDGLGYREVAAILGCSLGTVANRRYAALENLRRRLAP